MAYRSAQSSRHFRIVAYSQNENDVEHLELCAVCDAVVAGWAEGNTVCATCGMTVVEPPFEGSDYFDMIMRQSRPRRAARRRPG
jgi:hypothetical protein